MSGWEGVFLAVLSLGSSLASYCLGRESVVRELRSRRERRRRK
jgi:hypothetical protein